MKCGFRSYAFCFTKPEQFFDCPGFFVEKIKNFKKNEPFCFSIRIKIQSNRKSS